MKRSAMVLSAAAAVVAILLRGASAPAARTNAEASELGSSSSAELLASHADPLRIGDGGYSRD